MVRYIILICICTVIKKRRTGNTRESIIIFLTDCGCAHKVRLKEIIFFFWIYFYLYICNMYIYIYYNMRKTS